MRNHEKLFNVSGDYHLLHRINMLSMKILTIKYVLLFDFWFSIAFIFVRVDFED